MSEGEKINSSILTRLKQCSSTIDTSTSSFAILKKLKVNLIAPPIRTLPLPLESVNVVNKNSSKDSAASISVSSRTRSARPREQVDFKTLYVKESQSMYKRIMLLNYMLIA